jgi:hypothetical protein
MMVKVEEVSSGPLRTTGTRLLLIFGQQTLEITGLMDCRRDATRNCPGTNTGTSKPWKHLRTASSIPSLWTTVLALG